jgi:TPR repeat protein
VFEQLHRARVFLRICDMQGHAMVRVRLVMPSHRMRFHTLAPVLHPSFATAHFDRVNMLGSGITAMIAMMMSTCAAEPVPNARHQLADTIVKRLAAGRSAKTAEGLHARAVQMRRTGQCAAAAALLKQAIDLGHLPSRADLADMLYLGREGVACDKKRAKELAEDGARLGCHHCQGALAIFLMRTNGAECLALANESAAKGSCYGQRVLGYMHQKELAGVTVDYAKAVAFYQLAAAQCYDEAQNDLGFISCKGIGVEVDYLESMRWYQLAANQGHPTALRNIAELYLRGQGVAADKDKAIEYFRRAHAAGQRDAAKDLQKLGVRI